MILVDYEKIDLLALEYREVLLSITDDVKIITEIALLMYFNRVLKDLFDMDEVE